MNKQAINKLPILLLSLFGLCGVVNEAEARASYMLAGKLPSCGVCHWVTPSKGLRITKRYNEDGKLTYVGPYVEWEGGSVYTKADSYCKKKLRDDTATMEWWHGKCVAGENITPTSVQSTAAPGLVTKTGAIGEATSSAAATDVWSVSCPTNAAQLTVSVRDTAPKNPALVSIQIKKGDAASTVSIDTSEAGVAYSKEVSLAAGEGVYEVLVNKSESTKKGIENYSAKIACTTATEVVTGIDAIENIQDQ